MAVKVIMPKLGMAMTEGVVVKWITNDGEPVTKDTPIAVVMSKKISFEVKAPATGILRHAARVKETRPVGAAIAYVTEPGESVPEVVEVAVPPPPVPETVAPAATSPAAPPSAPKPAEAFVLASPAARRLAKEKGVDLAQVTGTGPEGRISEQDVLRFAQEQEARAAAPTPPPAISATSTARKMAEEHGLNLTRIPGSGPGGRITEEDVLRFMEGPKAPPTLPPARRTIPFDGMRQMIAERMMQSLQTMAQVTLATEADVTETVNLRQQLKQKFELSFTDLIVKAVALALKQNPLLNATLIGDEIQLLDEVHVGVAVALEDGLIVPVVRHADRLSLPEIALETLRLSQAARDGSLGVDEVTGSTFTVTNLGMYGMDFATPIINLPEVAILGVGRIVEKPAVYRGEIAIRSLMALSLTFDHRIVDGAPAAEFLQTVKGMLESPYLLLVR